MALEKIVVADVTFQGDSRSSQHMCFERLHTISSMSTWLWIRSYVTSN